MKNLLRIIVLGLFLSGCDSANSANVIYLKCTTTKAGMYVTGHYGTELGDVNYFEINRISIHNQNQKKLYRIF